VRSLSAAATSFVRQVLQRVRHVRRAQLLEHRDQVGRALGVGRADQAADPVVIDLEDVPAPGQPAGVLANRHLGDQPLVVAVQLHAQVDHVAGLVVRLHGDPAVQQVLEDQQLVRPLLEPAQVQRAGAEHHRLGVHAGDPADRQEDPAAQGHLGDQPDDLRRPVGGAQPDHRVADPAHPVAVGVEHGQRGEPRQVNPRPHGHRISLG
jgi:hypothetical protein